MGLAFSRQNRGVAPGLRPTLEFHALVVLELVRGCVMTPCFFVLSAKIVFSFNSYLDLYIWGFESIGARCKLACMSVCKVYISYEVLFAVLPIRIEVRGSVYRINLVVLRHDEVTSARLAGAD